MARNKNLLLLSISSSFVVGCATQMPEELEELEPTASGFPEHVIDRDDIGFFSDGDWRVSDSISGFQGSDYLIVGPGTGANTATWNLNIIRQFDVYVKWTSTPRRGSNVKYTVHYLDQANNLVTDTVVVDQRENGGEWFKLGTYKMSTLTGRVTTNDDADGWVVADAVLFQEIGVSGGDDVADTTGDSDGDGMSDEWEVQYGFDPVDPSDATLDSDGDGLSNLDEFLALTSPISLDTDGDGISDGYEVENGLNPTADDAAEDSDGDGFTNEQEFAAGTNPNDGTSLPDANTVILTWTTPTQRTDGSALAESDIAQYELSYQPMSATSSSEETVVDNESDAFITYGGGRTSSSYEGFIGADYFLMNPGSGEVIAEWAVTNLAVGVSYDIYAHWVSSGLRASNATYQYTFTNNEGQESTGSATVDQRANGGSWQEIGSFTTSDGQIVIRIDNDADGYVVADAIKLTPAAAPETTETIDADGNNSYVVRNLNSGQWQFRIRAIDTEGVAGEFSEPKTRTVE
ncbi:hypothetical protein QVZ43_11785 [Marinobacter sp. chi1]|uniref:Golvesin/Xly CBD-like domain-containing protein n=1 Tax=Marinobacter suaedae TaxID=3057675 RepID=A0ABT8W2D2_9GAMM|nr:hypothetical protein [Marinobacter sp. chi1]MDO3722404.1 hypothetical protein [Marinobacter sp. chi1]